MWVRSQNTNDSLKESNDLKRWNAELEIDRSHFETIRTADTEINLYVIIIVIIIFIMLCQCTWLILHSRKFNYSTRYIKCASQGAKWTSWFSCQLPEQFRFQVAGKIKGNTTRKKEKQNKERRSYIYTNYVTSSTRRKIISFVILTVESV